MPNKESKGPLKCPVKGCGRSYSDPEWFKRHVESHAGDQGAARPIDSSKTDVKASDAGGSNPPSPFAYPSLDDFERSKQVASAPAASAVPPGPTVYHFSLGPAWHLLGGFIDKSILKDKSVKIEMDKDKAAELDKSLSQVGFMVQNTNQPIVVPWWAPLAVSVVVTFVLPIILAIVMEKLEEWKAKKKKPDVKLEEKKIP